MDPSAATDAMKSFGHAFQFQPFTGVHLVSAGMHHGGCQGFYNGALNVGQALAILGKFDPEETLAAIERHRVTTAYMVPTQFVRMLRLPQEVRDRYDVSSLEVVVHSAAPCPLEVKKQMMDWWGPVIWETYGGMEGAATIAKPYRWLEKPGTVGRSVAGMKVKILDEDGNELPRGDIGHVYLESERGATFTYKGDPELTASVSKGKAFTLGDVGYMDEDGYLFINDRAKDMIISGGVNIYPAEVEGVLSEHPAVGDVAVIGVPDTEWGEQVKAIVELVEACRSERRAGCGADRVLPGADRPLQVPPHRRLPGAVARAPTVASSTSASCATSTGPPPSAACDAGRAGPGRRALGHGFRVRRGPGAAALDDPPLPHRASVARRGATRHGDGGPLRSGPSGGRGPSSGGPPCSCPAEHEGGSVTGQPLVDLVVLAEELGRELNPGPFVPCNVVADAIARFGTEVQSKEHLPRIARGEATCAWCLSGDGSPDPSAVEVRAAPRRRDGWQPRGSGPLRARRGRRDAAARHGESGREAASSTCSCRDRPAGLTGRVLTGLDLTRRFGEVRFDGVTVPGTAELAGGGPWWSGACRWRRCCRPPSPSAPPTTSSRPRWSTPRSVCSSGGRSAASRRSSTGWPTC